MIAEGVEKTFVALGCEQMAAFHERPISRHWFGAFSLHESERHRNDGKLDGKHDENEEKKQSKHIKHGVHSHSDDKHRSRPLRITESNIMEVMKRFPLFFYLSCLSCWLAFLILHCALSFAVPHVFLPFHAI